MNEMNLYVTVPIEEKLDTTDLTQTKTSFICKALDVTLEKKLETFYHFPEFISMFRTFSRSRKFAGKISRLFPEFKTLYEPEEV